MTKLVGVRWGDLKEETKEFLLLNSNIYGDIKEGPCIYDLTENLSIAGEIHCVNESEGDYEYIINDDEIIYDPHEGILDIANENVIFEINDVLTASEAAEIWGITEGAIRKAIASKRFVPGIDYRKAGRITLITREAMKRVYGYLN